MNTEIIRISDPEAQTTEINRVGEILRRGGIVAIPTETVYGLAGNAFDGGCVRKIFEAKGRPGDNPLIVHIADFDEIYGIAQTVPASAKALADKFWPGPLTIILKKKDTIPDEVTAGQQTVAVRMPSHPTARAIIKAAGVPLAAPSANISGFPSPTAVRYVIDDMNGRTDAIVDGGDCEFGIESTVLTLATPVPKILRPGAVTHTMIEEVIGHTEIDEAVLNPLKKGAVAASPGMKYKHYSPNAKLMIIKGTKEEFIAFARKNKGCATHILCFEGEDGEMPLPCVTFGKENDSLTQAHRFFDALRELDEAGADTVFVRAPSEEGVGLGVCNRLYRAAAFCFASEKKGRIYGICGASGSGKSTVCRYLEEKNCRIVDADKIARELLDTDKSVLERLALVFGEDIIKDGRADRRLIADRAFATKEGTDTLTGITHPAIIEKCRRQAEFFSLGYDRVFIDAPLLFTSGLNEICEKTIRVFAPEETRLERIMARDGISEESVLKRFASQQHEAELSLKADYTINNYGNYDPFEQTDRILSEE